MVLLLRAGVFRRGTGPVPVSLSSRDRDASLARSGCRSSVYVRTNRRDEDVESASQGSDYTRERTEPDVWTLARLELRDYWLGDSELTGKLPL
jgi:hypothetical protein